MWPRSSYHRLNPRTSIHAWHLNFRLSLSLPLTNSCFSSVKFRCVQLMSDVSSPHVHHFSIIPWTVYGTDIFTTESGRPSFAHVHCGLQILLAQTLICSPIERVALKWVQICCKSTPLGSSHFFSGPWSGGPPPPWIPVGTEFPSHISCIYRGKSLESSRWSLVWPGKWSTLC